MKMNKVLILLVLSLSLVLSCSSDDDGGGTQSNDPIIGEWQLNRVVFEGTEITLQACEELETYIFEPNTAFIIERFSPAPELPNQDCELENTNQGTWMKDDNGKYFFNLQGDFVELPVSINEEAEELTINEVDPLTGSTQQRIFVLQNPSE